MKWVHKFLVLSRGKQIGIVVCLTHLFTIFGLLAHHLATQKLKPPRPIVVRTHSAVAERNIPAAKPQNSGGFKPQTPAAKPTKKNTPTTKAKPGPVVKKTVPKQEVQALKEIAQSFETLSVETKQPRPALSLPSKIAPKAQIIEKPEVDPSYGEFLIAYLQSALDLPEYGEVRAKIEIDRFGRLVDCEILETKSRKNAEFLKNQLPDLSFPCLNDYGIMDATETFTITFRNVEIH